MRAIEIAPAGGRRGDVLLVPGADLCAEFYAPLGEALARRGVRAVLLTLPGFHGVPPCAAPTFDAYVDAVLGAFAAHLPGGGTLAGHSLGGLLALLAAARRPAGLRALALLEPAIPPGPRLARRAARTYERSTIDGDRARFQNWSGAFTRVADPAAFPRRAIDLYLESRRASDPATLRALFRALPSLYPLPFDRIAAPVLLVRGARSGWRGRAAAWALARRLPGARTVTIEGAAHWLANERDDAVAEALCAAAT